MGNVIIIIVLCVALFFAIRSSLKHFKGEGGCCGGGPDIKPEKKKLENQKIAEKVISIEGMHCDHCKNTVERYINDIEGAVAKVNLRKNIAVVSMDRKISDEELKLAVEKAGFKVINIENKEIANG
ncbi:heavy-metal-associated domain-containing protein [Clostridium sp. MSJ-8]|uniref:heavy-metal-associated domain-containing protein n=1 Tax=Clostridium sp. MSJ-8 TaxID=2841510 RepID=UPI001C0EB3B3|nr:heavy-metal-associated domain-containing protein [Clostridium sp. MSJ-8]MBU5488854.1 heavy-metal-associated domain-containing protein [Clostridium sp. MSJ-8]